MSGTSDGNKKGYKTLLKKKGKKYIKETRAKAGSAKVNKGYAVRRELAAINGKKGAEKRWTKKRAEQASQTTPIP